MNTKPTQRLAARIRDKAEASGLSQQQVADALHMSQSALSRRYLGYVEYRASELHALAKLLGTSVAELTDDDDDQAVAS